MMQRKNLLRRAALPALVPCLAFSMAFGSAQAQWLGKPGQRDVAVGAAAHLTFDARGNGVRQKTDPSLGALVSFHSSYQWSRGFVLNYGYTRVNEDMQGDGNNPYGTDFAPSSSGIANRHEFTAAYLVKGPKLFWGLRPFGEAGGGALLFLPSSGHFEKYHHIQVENTNTQTIEDLTYSETLDVSSQTRAAGLFGAGLDWALDRHWGGRLEYRALAFVAPSFQQWDFNSRAYTLSQAPTLSLYYKF
ncbi:MAG TPA: hypothetical protein VFE22_09890 [Edaphobacter sp.]|nr:hypothetical protein [Edaphobacter sp.]